ncbi:MAG: hypothetical protein RAO94_02220 [Candidatus Stygibacter australis]|nr:hypothetical protein [Candidatus Stygibacter australis]
MEIIRIEPGLKKFKKREQMNYKKKKRKEMKKLLKEKKKIYMGGVL